MEGSARTNLSPIKEAAIDITWVLAQLKLTLKAGDKGKKRELEIGPDNLDDLPSAKRYLFNFITVLNCQQILMKFRSKESDSG